jgi:two-component system phosphate regulon sensor histidine kinase PhoR
MASANSTELASYELPLPEPAEPADRLSRKDLRAPLPRAMLARNTLWYWHLRWIVIAVLAAFGLLGFCGDLPHRLGLKSGAVWPLVVAGVVAAYNVLVLFHFRHVRQSQGPRGVLSNLWGQILLDLLALTAVIHFVGSMETNAAFAYLFHIALACIFFTPRQSLWVTGAACAFYLGCIAAEQTGLLGPAGIFLEPVLARPDGSTRGQAVVSLLSVWTVLLVVWYLASHLSLIVRRRDRQLIEANLRLIAARKERTRHMLHTAHELKAPCSAIDANVQLLLQGYCGELTPDASDVLSRVGARCRAMTAQVQDMIQLADLRSEGRQFPPRRTLDAAEVLRWCLAQVSASAEQKGVVIQTDLEPAETVGVVDHLRMLFVNVLANAVNYSHDGGVVRVGCRLSMNAHPEITVADEGIGIPGDRLPHIFDDYYRTPHAAEHNRGSSGLGLAIARHVAHSHGIRVRVESRVGRGTRFVVRLTPSDSAAQEAPGAQETTYGEHPDC